MSVSHELAWSDGPTPVVWSDGHRFRIELGWRAAVRLGPPIRDLRWWRNLCQEAGWL